MKGIVHDTGVRQLVLFLNPDFDSEPSHDWNEEQDSTDGSNASDVPYDILELFI
jgi:hypothetical protein